MFDTTSLSDIRKWPLTVTVPQACGPLHISRSYGFELARTGRFPCRVITVGTRRRVVTSSLVALLENGDGAAASAEPQGAA